MFLIILIKSLIIGGLVGVGVGAGAARMFHAPTTQGMGAFRTLGELNSCGGRSGLPLLLWPWLLL
ncbi:inner membrane protein [Klebsiella pneumoniae subsp. rhinoscleromatis]|nr:inner membrane protein [Klebsiella pneumoniae subsp. rhinoscleromatis]